MSETLVEFGPEARPGLAELRQQALECGGTADPASGRVTYWSPGKDQPSWTVQPFGSTVLGLTVTDSQLSRRSQLALADLALTKSRRSRS